MVYLMDKPFLRIGVLVALLLVVGCGAVPKNVERSASYALADTDATVLGRLVGPGNKDNPGMSGVRLLTNPSYTTRQSLHQS